MSAERVCGIDDLETDSALRVVVGGTPVAVVKDAKGDVFAIGDTCTHGDISLAEGFVEDDTLECWAHGSKFSLATGRPLSLPAYRRHGVHVQPTGRDGVAQPAERRIPATGG